MKFRLLFAGFAASILAGPLPAQDAPVRDAPAAQGTAQPANDLASSGAAVAHVDPERLIEDREYAGEIARHLDVLDAATEDPRMRAAIDGLRMTAFSTLGDHDRVRQAADRLLSSHPSDPALYGLAWWAVIRIPDYSRALAIIEEASRRVPGVGWAGLRERLGPQSPMHLIHHFGEESHDDMSLARTADALNRIGWPGGGDLQTADYLRMILVENRVDQGDQADAANLAAMLVTPASTLNLILLRRYDALLPRDIDRLARLRTVIDAFDRQTLELMGESPSLLRTLQRAQFLRSVGRERDALALLEPHTHDIRATVAADEYGMLVVNEAAFALLSLGREDEAIAVMERVAELSVADNPYLMGLFINRSVILLEADRPAEALALTTRLDREFSQFTNDYGKMWIAASTVCALAALGRSAEALPTVERLRTGFDNNPSALTIALLCLNDLDAVEAVVIRQLEGDDPETMVVALQNYTRSPEVASGPSPLYQRLQAVRERPAVRAALERVGRILDLPLSQTYWGNT